MKKLAEAKITTKYGIFKEVLYNNSLRNVSVLIKGSVSGKNNILCRVHSHCIAAHYFHGIECDCYDQMVFSQRMIEKEGNGIIIWLDQEGRGNGHLAKMLAEEYKAKGLTQSEAYVKAGFSADARKYDDVKFILEHQKIKSIALISNSQQKKSSIEEMGIIVSQVVQTPVFNA